MQSLGQIDFDSDSVPAATAFLEADMEHPSLLQPLVRLPSNSPEHLAPSVILTDLSIFCTLTDAQVLELREPIIVEPIIRINNPVKAFRLREVLLLLFP